MTFYKMEYKVGEEVGKTYPQSQEFDSKISIHESNHVWNLWGKFPENAYIPDSILHIKAKVTDLISSSPIIHPIVSERLKNIIAEYRSFGIQFFPTQLIVKGKKLNYWLLNEFEYDYNYIDFERSIINIIRTGREKVSVLNLKSAQELEMAKQYVPINNPNESVWIEKLELLDNIQRHILFFDKISGSNFYLSEKVKNHIESVRCTGIQFVRYDKKKYP